LGVGVRFGKASDNRDYHALVTKLKLTGNQGGVIIPGKKAGMAT